MILGLILHLATFLEHWIQLNTCMFCSLLILEVLLGIVFNWLTLGLWFYKLSFETSYTMSLQVFSRKLAQKGQIWCIVGEFWAWGSNLEIPDFGLTLERKTPRSSVHTVFMQYALAGKMTLEQ